VNAEEEQSRRIIGVHRRFVVLNVVLGIIFNHTHKVKRNKRNITRPAGGRGKGAANRDHAPSALASRSLRRFVQKGGLTKCGVDQAQAKWKG
jgi:hypothetical protein